MSKILDNNYFQITGWMLNRLKLKGTALNVYAIIYGFSQDGESSFKGSRQYLCDFTGATKPTIDKALAELQEMNLIIKTSNRINDVVHNEYKVNIEVLNDFTTSKETLPPSKETLQGGSKETLPNNNNNINNNNDNNICQAEAIITYLNEKAGTRFKPVESNLKFIKARLKDYSIERLKAVIDLKVKEWRGTKMQPYLRPETLFNATKFEAYSSGLQAPHEHGDINKRSYSKEDYKGMFQNVDEIIL